MTDKRIVLTTAASREEAQKIAHALVEDSQAACVNIAGPVESVYRWKGAVENASEWLLIIKTTADAAAEVCASIKRLHSYDLPECIQLAIEDGYPPYLGWIGESVRKHN